MLASPSYRSVIHFTLYTDHSDENGITDILYSMSNNNDLKRAWIYWKLNPINATEMGSIIQIPGRHKNKRGESWSNTSQQDLRRRWCTEVEPNKHDENEVTDLKVEEHATDRSCTNTFPVPKGKHLMLHSLTYAKETTKCKTIKKCRNSTTSENDKHSKPTPKQGTLFNPTNIATCLVTTGLVDTNTHTHTHKTTEIQQAFYTVPT